MRNAATTMTRARAAGAALLGLLAASALAVAASAAINSNLTIPAGETFALGGGQEGSFTVTGRNTGPVAVEVLKLKITGDTAALGMGYVPKP